MLVSDEILPEVLIWGDQNRKAGTIYKKKKNVMPLQPGFSSTDKRKDTRKYLETSIWWQSFSILLYFSKPLLDTLQKCSRFSLLNSAQFKLTFSGPRFWWVMHCWYDQAKNREDTETSCHSGVKLSSYISISSTKCTCLLACTTYEVALDADRGEGLIR